MANTRIAYDVSKPFGEKTAYMVGCSITAYEDAKRIKEALDAMSDFAQMETELGIEAGQGEAFYGVIANAVSNLNTAITELKKIDMGVEL